ncbi:endonuclease/exonuclease/phosphatase family protein [Streptomyces sp. NPDC056716]|uniref:endonuclease/exonuclease/phosphatase family protein n=1 Tax=unclassified Streptomyces TaxID=2593676 RepID=UPI00369C70AD
MTTIKLITFNLEVDGGKDEGGKPSQRWQAAHELLAARHPDAVFRQEMTHSRADGRARLHLAEQALGGMRGFLGPVGTKAGEPQHPTGILVRPGVFTVTREYALTDWRTPPTNVIATLDGVPDVPIIMVSCHLTPTSPGGREREADDLARLVGVGRGGGWIGAGDMNEYPVPDGEEVPPVDWTSPTIRDLPHIQHRTNEGPDGTRVSCIYVDKKLRGCGLVDPARHAAHVLGQRSALSATAGWAPGAKGQGGPSRIDRWYISQQLVPAVREVNVLDMSGISDHNAVELVLDRAKAVEGLRRGRDRPQEPAHAGTGAQPGRRDPSVPLRNL